MQCLTGGFRSDDAVHCRWPSTTWQVDGVAPVGCASSHGYPRLQSAEADCPFLRPNSVKVTATIDLPAHLEEHLGGRIWLPSIAKDAILKGEDR